MNLAGTVVIRKSPQAVAAALVDPAVVKAAIPFCKSLRALRPGQYLVRIEHPSLPIGLDVDLSLLPAQDGAICAIKAGNLMVGKVRSDLNICLAAASAGSRLDWSGDLAATGLAGKLLTGREADVQARVLAIFRRMKTLIEAPQPAAPATGAA